MMGLTHKLNTFALITHNVLLSKHHKRKCHFSNVCVLLMNVSMMPRLKQDIRNQAIGMLAAGMAVGNVAGRLRVHRNTIGSLTRRYRINGNVRDSPRSGRPRVTTPAQERYIVNVHLR